MDKEISYLKKKIRACRELIGFYRRFGKDLNLSQDRVREITAPTRAEIRLLKSILKTVEDSKHT